MTLDEKAVDVATTVLPAWVQNMRAAAQKVLKQEDVEEIVKNRVEAAKKGDKHAIRFVFDQVLGGVPVKAAQIVQNNFYGEADRPDKPTKALPGSRAKIEAMRRRVASGQSACSGRDGAPNLD